MSEIENGHGSPTWQTYARALDGRRLPAAFCDLDLLESNARALVARGGGLPIRVASKSVRCRQVLRATLASGGFEGLLVYSAAEAAFLAGHDFDDLVVAYPTVERADLEAAARAVAEGCSITLMVDAAEQLPVLSDVAGSVGIGFELCLDLDLSLPLPGLWFGVRRSPLRSPEEALTLARRIADTPHLRLVGLMGYEAQIAGIADAAPGGLAKAVENRVVRGLKARSMRELAARRTAVVDALRREGFDLRFVNGGGTGSLESTAADSSVTELTAGSGLFSPHLFDGYHHFRHAPAAGFALPVTRRPTESIVTCHGGGYVASGAPGWDKVPTPYLPSGARLLPHEGAGEVQTPVDLSRCRQRPSIGEPVFFRHAKAGELCEHFDRLLLIRGGEVVGEAPTYRGDGMCFL